ncbi:MAG: hypothetical protein JWO30_4033 [Fibrobacteres bacterium]|nr:hypothetical protein [Fibrobacterota bacterium]
MSDLFQNPKPDRMAKRGRILLPLLSLFAAVFVLPGHSQVAPKFSVLLYDKGPAGEGYVHTAAKLTLKDSAQAWGRQYGFTVDVAEDPTLINTTNLAKYQVVVFNNISAEVVDALPLAGQKTALLEYMKTGGFVANHAVTEAGRWPEMVSLLGAKMSNHTSEVNLATATLNLDTGSANHPIITGMAATGTKLALVAKISLADEWYTYTSNPRSVSGVKILYTLDEKTFTPAGAMGADHPIAWIRTLPTGGRIFYSGIGHAGGFLTPAFTRSLFINAILWAAKMDANVGIRKDADRPSQMEHLFEARSTGPSQLSVSVRLEGRYRVEVRSMDGKLLASRAGKGFNTYAFKGLRHASPVSVEVESADRRGSQVARIR